MKKFLIVAAAAALAAPGAAVAMNTQPPSAAEAAALDYKTTLRQDGTVVFEGEDTATDRRFRFKLLSNGVVAGHIGDRQVRYAVDKNLRDRLVAKLRQRAVRGEATAGLSF